MVCASFQLLLLFLAVFQVHSQGTYTNTSKPLSASTTTWCSASRPSGCTPTIGCEIYAATVQVFYFPTANRTASASAGHAIDPVIAVSNGYTFTSPSVYVAFTSIAAGYSNDQPPDFMSTTGNCPMTVGSQYFNVTRAYPPDYLMTIPRSCNYHMNLQGKQWGTLRVQDLMNPPQNWIAGEGCAGQGAAPLREDLPPNGTDMAGRPLLSYPGDILTLDPAWPSNCCSMDMWNWGFCDPPRTLDPVTMLSPTAAEPSPSSEPHSHSLDPHPTPAGRMSPSFAASTAVPSYTQLIVSATSTSAIHVASTVADRTSLRKTLAGDPQAHAPELEPVVVTTIGADPMYGMPNGDVSIAGQIISLDGPAMTIDKTPISVDHQRVHVGNIKHSVNRPIPSLSPTPTITADSTASSPGFETHVIATVGNDPMHAMPNGGVSIAGHVVSVGGPQSGSVAIGDKTIDPGQQQRAGGNHVSVGTARMVIGSKTHAIPWTAHSTDSPQPHVSPLPSIDGQSLKLNSGGAIVVGDLTVTPGQHRVIGSNTLIANSDHPIINGHTYSVPWVPGAVPAQPTGKNPPQIVGGQVLEAGDHGGVLLGGSSILPGQQTDIHGTYLSVGAGSMIIESKTYEKPSTKPTGKADLADASSALRELAGGTAVSLASNGAVVLGGSTISPGQDTVVHGTYVSVNNNGVIIGSSTYDTSKTGSTARNAAAPALAAAVGTTAISVASNGAVVASGSTLSPGVQMTISGRPISVGSDVIIIGSSTYALPNYPTISTASNGAFIIDHRTFSIGELTTISGRLMQVGSSNIVIGGTTYPIPTPTGIGDGPLTSIDLLGQLVASMFGYAPSSSPNHLPSSTSGGDLAATSIVSGQNASSSRPTLSSFTSAQTRIIVDRAVLISAFLLCTYLGALTFAV